MKFLRINRVSVIIVVLLDWMSLLFIRFVLYISRMVIYYRLEYIHGDLNIKRFIILVVIFVLSIILLIISPNLIRILLGWDGLGLVSYCLVIYYQNIKSYNAGILTALTNRIGDVALLISIAWIINYGRWNYIYYLEFIKYDYSIQIVTLLVILAALTKRAQIPFSSWLPAAIAAPTPVSSLVHSSTLVTAGVYLLIRFNYSIRISLINLLLVIGCLTIFIAGLGANFEFDLKKIIALSTLRQLGLIIRILSLGEFKLGFFHLLRHALFKATLFICAGCIIHSLSNCQDIRFIGGLVKTLPLTCCIFNISNLALCGIPFLSGFYSKDLILEVVSINYLNIFIYLIYFISTGLTVIYRIRLVYYSIIGRFNFLSLNYLRDHGSIILKGIIGLVFFVVIGGSRLIWLIFPTPYFICLPNLMKLIALIVTILGAWLGLEISLFYLNYNLKSLRTLSLSFFFSQIWFIPLIRTYIINYRILNLGKFTYLKVDQGWSEFWGAQKIFLLIKDKSLFIQNYSINRLKGFFLLLFIYFIIMIILLYLNSLCKEHNIEDIKVIELFLSIYKNMVFYYYNENVMFLLNYINKD